MLFVLLLSMSMVSANEIGDNITSINDELPMESVDNISSVSVESPIETVDNIDCVNKDINLNDSNVLQTSSQEVIQSGEDVIVVNDWNELQYYCAQKDKDYTLKLKENTNFYPSDVNDANQQIKINNNVKIIGSEGSYIGDDSSSPSRIKYTAILVPDNSKKSSLNMENITFKWINTLHQPDGIFLQMGGVKYNNVLKNCVFKDIYVEYGHSCIVYLKKGTATLDNCSFINCRSYYGSVSVYDPASVKTTHMIVRNCYFENNYGEVEPGCINNCGSLTVINSTFVKNRSFWWAGAIHTHGDGITTIYDSNFTDNVAGWNGGALYTYGTLKVYNTIFIGNNCTTDNGGGAIGSCKHLSVPYIYIEGCLFEKNSNNCWGSDALSDGPGRGGAISLMDEGILEVRSTTFIANAASIGTAICAIEAGSYGSPDVILINNSFINHTRNGDVLHIRVANTTVNVSDNYYYGNSIVFSNLTLSKLSEGREQATFQITATLSHPTYYDEDILDKTLYDVYINNKYVKTVNSTVFSVDFGDLDICDVYVIPTISNRKSNEVTITSTREYVFVSKSNGNDSNNGIYRDKPVSTIKRALELANVCQNIILLDGDYSESDVQINYGVTIKGEGNACLTGTTSFISNANFTLKNLKINNLNSENFIKQNKDNLVISKCVFINNDAVLVYNNAFASLTNSILLNNSKIVDGNINDCVLDCNWWGNVPSDLGSYVTLNLTSDVNALENNQKANVKAVFYLNDGSKYSNLPDINLDIIALNGAASQSTVSIDSSFVYTLTAFSDGALTVSYNNVNITKSFEFLKSNPGISLETNDIMFGDDVVITVTTPSDAEGNLTVNIGNLSQTKQIQYTKTTFTFENLKADTYAITLTYSGDKKYQSKELTSTVNVNKYESTTKLNLSTVNVGQDVIITVNTISTSTGNVTLSINNDTQTLTLTNSKANYTIKNIKRGDYLIKAIYNGDDKYLTSQDTKFIEVDNLNATMNITADDITYGETAIIKVTLNDDANGNVIVTIDGVSNQSKLTNGKAEVTFTNLEAGSNKNINVFYSGDDTYFNLTKSGTFNIAKSNLEFTISSSDIKIGQFAEIVITVPQRTSGTFTINQDVINIPLSGEVSYIIPDLEIGNYTYTATYNGNNYYTVSKTTSFTVSEYPIPQVQNEGFNTQNTHKSQYETLTNGNIAFTIPFNETLSGDLVVDSLGNVYLPTQNGIYAFNQTRQLWYFTSTAAAGNLSAIAISRDVIIAPKSGDTLYFINQTTGERYGGSNIYQGSSLFAPIVDANATLYISSEYQTDSEDYKLTIIPYKLWENGGDSTLISIGNTQPLCAPTLNGNIIVVVSDNRLRIIDAKTLQTLAIKSGNYMPIRPIIGEGNIVYAILSDSVVAYNSNGVQVWKTRVTSGVGTTLALDNEQGLYHVNSRGVLYKYDLIDGSQSKFSSLKVTSGILIDASNNLYLGSNNMFYALNSEGNILWKSDLNSKITGNPVMDESGLIYVPTENGIVALTHSDLKEPNLKIQIDDIVEGQTATLTVTWNSEATGTVTCNVNGEEITANANDLKITKVISGLGIGYYDVEASYDGDMRFQSTTATKTFVVRSTDDVANNIQFDGNRTFSFSLNNAKGNLTVKVNDKSYSKVLVNGKATISVSDLTPGEYEAIVTYSGDSVYNSASRTFTVSVPKFNVTLNEQITTENIVSTVSVALPSDATGNLTLSIGTKKYTQKVSNGKAVIIVDDIPAGNYTATLAYSGDDNYNGASKTVSINPTKIPVTLDDSNVFVKSGSEPVISIKLDSSATGKFVVNVDGEEYTADITDDIIISDLEVGNYTGTLTYGGDRKYDKASYVISFEVLNTTPIDNTTNTTIDNSTALDNSTNTTGDNSTNSTVEKANPTLIVSASDVNVGEDAIINVKASFENGKVTVNINNKDYELNINSFESSLTIQNLAVGNYTVIVTFAGDDKFNPASNSTNFNVLKVNIPVTDETITLPDGNSTSYSVNLPADATGTLTVTVDGTDYTSQLVNGKATVNIPELDEGTHNITVAYSGDSKYEAITKSSIVNVNKTDVTNTTDDNGTAIDNSTTAKSDVTIIVTAGDVNVGEDALIQVTSSEDSIKLTVLVNNKQYALGDDGTVTISNLAVGKYNVIVMFAGDDKFNSASNSTTFNVIKISVPVTDETITLPDSNSTSYSVNLPADATGTLTVTVDGEKYTETLVNGKATVNIPELSEGTHNITVAYSGDSKYEAITKSSIVNVNKTDITNTTGDNSTVIDNTTNTTTDNGTAIDNSTNTTIDNGTAIDNTTNTTVEKVDSTLVVSVSDVNVGDDVIINVKASFESGKVSVNVNGKDYQLIISNGEASASISDLAVGNYIVLVRFAGDDKLNPASNSTSFNVFKVNVPVTDETVTVPSGDSTTYGISLPSDATGTLTVTVDGVNYTETLVNGKATVNIPELTEGSHNITVTYSGDAKYSPITKSSVVVKEHVPVIKLTGSNLNMLYTSGKYFKVRLTADGQPLAGQTVKITINGKTYSRTTNANGYASIKIKLAPKTYTVKATYANLTITKKVTVKSIIKAKNVNAKRSAKTVKIKVTLKKVNGKYLKNKKITLKFNKKTFKAKTNKKGVATFTIKNSVYKKLKTNKKYTYQVIYGKDKVKKTIKFKK